MVYKITAFYYYFLSVENKGLKVNNPAVAGAVDTQGTGESTNVQYQIKVLAVEALIYRQFYIQRYSTHRRDR